MSEPGIPKLDKTHFSVTSLHSIPDEKDYWAGKTPAERLEALEIMRRIIYGYNPATERLQRFFEVAQRKPG